MSSQDPWRQYTDADANELATTTPANEMPTSDQFDQVKLGELHDAREFRKDLVKFTRLAVGSVLLSSVAVMGLYIRSEWHELDRTVIIAFFTSVVAETLGILYIIAAYLFPKGGARPNQ